MYRPCKWVEVRKELLNGLDAEGALEAGFDACLLSLYKRGRIMPCACDAGTKLLALTAEDVDLKLPEEIKNRRMFKG